MSESSLLPIGTKTFRTALAGDSRDDTTLKYLEQLIKRATHGLPPSSRFAAEVPADLDRLKAGTFVLFCILYPLPLLNERLQDSGMSGLVRVR